MPHTPLYTPFQLFTPKECRKLIKLAQRQHVKVRGWTVGGIHSVRTNSIWWLHQDFAPPNWNLYRRIRTAMSARPDLPMDWISPHWQVSLYEAGQFYGWHTDTITKWSDQGRRSQRSLTLTANLQSAPGARIETEHHQWELPQGWAVMFPAGDLHRATAPTSGQRWAFTAWGMVWNTDYLLDDDTEPTT